MGGNLWFCFETSTFYITSKCSFSLGPSITLSCFILNINKVSKYDYLIFGRTCHIIIVFFNYVVLFPMNILGLLFCQISVSFLWSFSGKPLLLTFIKKAVQFRLHRGNPISALIGYCLLASANYSILFSIHIILATRTPVDDR